MKKLIGFILVLTCLLCLGGCGNQTPKRVRTIQSDTKTYYELSDGTWECNGYIYKHKLEISGRMNNAAKDSTFVYLSNDKNITFEQAWKAAGFSSNMGDYFAVKDAVLVDMR